MQKAGIAALLYARLLWVTRRHPAVPARLTSTKACRLPHPSHHSCPLHAPFPCTPPLPFQHTHLIPRACQQAGSNAHSQGCCAAVLLLSGWPEGGTAYPLLASALPASTVVISYTPCHATSPSVTSPHAPAPMYCRHMGGQHHPLSTRQTAVEAWIEAGKPAKGERATALRLFREKVDGGSLPANPSEFLDTWVEAWLERGSVADKPPEPRKSRIDDATAKECVRQLEEGYYEGGRHRFFWSLRQAKIKNAYIRNVLATHLDPMTDKELARCSLWRRIKAVVPTLTRRTLRFTFKLTATHKTARVNYCKRLLGMPEAARKRYLARVVWIDSKKLYVMSASPACPLLPLQRMKDGPPEQGVTRAEFKDIMTEIKTTANTIIKDDWGRRLWAEATGGTPEEYPPSFPLTTPPSTLTWACFVSWGWQIRMVNRLHRSCSCRRTVVTCIERLRGRTHAFAKFSRGG